MSQFDFDVETFIVFPLFALGTAASLGIVGGNDVLPWINLSDVLLTTGGIEWTLGRLVSLGALVAVILHRDESVRLLQGWGVVELWVFYATVGLIVAPPFFPALEETLAATPAAFIAFTVQSIGFGLITWIN